MLVLTWSLRFARARRGFTGSMGSDALCFAFRHLSKTSPMLSHLSESIGPTRRPRVLIRPVVNGPQGLFWKVRLHLELAD